MEINRPDVVAEVTKAFNDYERALVTNDVDTLQRLFFQSPTTVRYGAGENLYGEDEINAFRAMRSPVGLERELQRTQITTYGTDTAVAATLFVRAGAAGKIGRQMQTWARFADGWKVVAAHVSIIQDPMSVEDTVGNAERRGAPRFKTLKAAQIVMNSGHSTVDCIVRNRSESGMLLKLNGPMPLPPELDLLVDGQKRPVRLVWKKGLEFGVAYL